MFAYCNNNPINYYDPAGIFACVAEPTKVNYDTSYFGGTSGGEAIVLGISALCVNTVTAVYKLLKFGTSEVYAFSRAIIDTLSGRYENHQPRVHHTVPRGKFYHYGLKYVSMMNAMHDLLNSVGIDINDPLNLLICSHGTHKSMHTKDYIQGIYDIMMNANKYDRDSVETALFWARIYAASWDHYSIGY